MKRSNIGKTEGYILSGRWGGEQAVQVDGLTTGGTPGGGGREGAGLWGGGGLFGGGGGGYGGSEAGVAGLHRSPLIPSPLRAVAGRTDYSSYSGPPFLGGQPRPTLPPPRSSLSRG